LYSTILLLRTTKFFFSSSLLRVALWFIYWLYQWILNQCRYSTISLTIYFIVFFTCWHFQNILTFFEQILDIFNFSFFFFWGIKNKILKFYWAKTLKKCITRFLISFYNSSWEILSKHCHGFFFISIWSSNDDKISKAYK